MAKKIYLTVAGALLLTTGHAAQEVGPLGADRDGKVVVASSAQSSLPAFSGDSVNRNSYKSTALGGNEVQADEVVIPNAPIITPSSIIEISAVGMGVAPESTISPAHALALAKRAAIVDAYRQIGEKMYGIRINAQDTVRDMVLKNSTVKTKVLAVIRNAEIIETVYKDGLCQVSMELKLDGKRWYRILTGEEF